MEQPESAATIPADPKPAGVVDDPAAAFGLSSDTVRSNPPKRAFGAEPAEKESDRSDG
jgi:hypothetical protein